MNDNNTTGMRVLLCALYVVLGVMALHDPWPGGVVVVATLAFAAVVRSRWAIRRWPFLGPRAQPDGERCHCCGCQYRTVWWCGDRDSGELWARVYEQATGRQQLGEAGLLCPQCADNAGRELGITLRWMAMPYWVQPTEPAEALAFLAKVEAEVHALEAERHRLREALTLGIAGLSVIELPHAEHVADRMRAALDGSECSCGASSTADDLCCTRCGGKVSG